jgi:DNA invertase Pin-like site-specific DNA recombinase
LVALHFVSQKADDDQFVIHLDYDKLNNEVTNLKWVTRAQLTAHNRLNPANLNKRKPSTGKHYKLNPGKVKIIKQMLLSGKSRPKMIAKQFGITSTQVTRIKKGENWKHVS